MRPEDKPQFGQLLTHVLTGYGEPLPDPEIDV
jgi:hypothetical protein